MDCPRLLVGAAPRTRAPKDGHICRSKGPLRGLAHLEPLVAARLRPPSRQPFTRADALRVCGRAAEAQSADLGPKFRLRSPNLARSKVIGLFGESLPLGEGAPSELCARHTVCGAQSAAHSLQTVSARIKWPPLQNSDSARVLATRAKLVF